MSGKMCYIHHFRGLDAGVKATQYDSSP